jgi:hypothetical protein
MQVFSSDEKGSTPSFCRKNTQLFTHFTPTLTILTPKTWFLQAGSQTAPFWKPTFRSEVGMVAIFLKMLFLNSLQARCFLKNSWILSKPNLFNHLPPHNVV